LQITGFIEQPTRSAEDTMSKIGAALIDLARPSDVQRQVKKTRKEKYILKKQLLGPITGAYLEKLIL
jgi:hypothetical protein